MTQPDAPLPYATPYGQIYDPDAEHLRLLSVFHFVLGPLYLLFGCLPVIYVILGVVFLAEGNKGDPAALGVAAVFLAVGLGGMAALWTVGGLTIYVGWQLRRRRRRMLSLIVAGINCLFFPFGTALGVFTLIVLCRRSVEDSYRQTQR